MPAHSPRAGATTRSIAAKRATTTVGAIKRKAAKGQATGKERASIRVGTGTTRLLTGQEDLSTWDDEELRRGQRRDRNGRFQGRQPRVVPKAVHDELVRRTLDQANKLFTENLVAAVEALCQIALDPGVEPKDRLRAVQMITDRSMGKSPEKVEVSADQPWLVALQGAIVSIGATEATEDDDDDEEQDS